MMTVPTVHDRSLLPLIDRALAEPGWLPAVPAPLRADYEAERLQQCRLFNRRLLILLTLVFDVYWVGEFVSAPEIVSLSGLLRFGLMTPAVILFVALDRQGKIGRHYGGWLLLLTMAPAFISALLCIRSTSAAALLDIRATPETVRGVAERVRAGVEQLAIAHAGLSPVGIVTLSLGYGCMSPHRGVIMRDLVAISDGELYAAKRCGRNVAMCAQDDDRPVI
jgi:hypothetical protein